MSFRPKTHFDPRLLFPVFAGGLALVLIAMRVVPHAISSLKNAEPSPILRTLLPSATASLEVHCLSEDEIQKITGNTYALVQENYQPTAKILECSYRSDRTIRDTTPTIRYFLHFQVGKKDWQVQAEWQKHDVSELPDFYVMKNPVLELNQATFYAWKNSQSLELSYSPIEQTQDELQAKGTQLCVAVQSLSYSVY